MIERFLLDVPSCISGFDMFQREHLDEYSIEFSLLCKFCGSNKFSIFCYPIVAEDDETYANIEAGQIVERPPHHLECSSCKRRELLFDPEVHGYDGALGHGSSYERGEGKDTPIVSSKATYQVKVQFFYQIEFGEMLEIAKETGVRPQDLFDGIAIHAMESDGNIIKMLGFECA